MTEFMKILKTLSEKYNYLNNFYISLIFDYLLTY